MLELKEVHYHPSTAEKPVLNGVTLQAKLGHPIIIAGESGSGKTSLVEIIGGLTTPQEGCINWQEQQVRSGLQTSTRALKWRTTKTFGSSSAITQETFCSLIGRTNCRLRLVCS